MLKRIFSNDKDFYLNIDSHESNNESDDILNIIDNEFFKENELEENIKEIFIPSVAKKIITLLKDENENDYKKNLIKLTIYDTKEEIIPSYDLFHKNKKLKTIFNEYKSDSDISISDSDSDISISDSDSDISIPDIEWNELLDAFMDNAIKSLCSKYAKVLYKFVFTAEDIKSTLDSLQDFDPGLKDIISENIDIESTHCTPDLLVIMDLGEVLKDIEKGVEMPAQYNLNELIKPTFFTNEQKVVEKYATLLINATEINISLGKKRDYPSKRNEHFKDFFKKLYMKKSEANTPSTKTSVFTNTQLLRLSTYFTMILSFEDKYNDLQIDKKLIDILAEFSIFPVQCVEGTINKLNELCKSFKYLFFKESIIDGLSSKIINELKLSSQTNKFLDKKGIFDKKLNEQHHLTNIIEFLRKNNLYQGLSIDKYKMYGDEFNLDFYYSLIVNFGSPYQQFLEGLEFDDVVFSKEKQYENYEDAFYKDLQILKDYGSKEFNDKFFKNIDIFPLDLFKYIANTTEKTIKLATKETTINVFLTSEVGTYYHIDNTEITDLHNFYFLPYQILIFENKTTNPIFEIKPNSNEVRINSEYLYIVNYDFVKKAFIVSTKEQEFDASLDNVIPTTRSFNDLKKLPAKVACYNINYDSNTDNHNKDNPQYIFELNAQAQRLNAFEYFITNTSISNISFNFTKESQIKKIRDVYQLMHHKFNNNVVDINFDGLNELPFDALVNISNFLIYLFEMTNVTSLIGTDRVYLPENKKYMTLFHSAEAFTHFYESLMKKSDRYDITYLMIFAKYIATIDYNQDQFKLTEQFERLDSIFNFINDRDTKKELSKKIIYRMINANEFNNNELFILDKIILAIYIHISSNEPKTIVNEFNELALSLYSNIRLSNFEHKFDRHQAYQDNNNNRKLSIGNFFLSSFIRKGLIELPEVNDCNQHKYLNDLASKYKSFFPNHIDNHIINSTFRLIVFYMLVLSIVAAFLSMYLIANILFQLACTLIVINCIENLFVTKNYIIHQHNKLQLSQSDFAFFNKNKQTYNEETYLENPCNQTELYNPSGV